VEINALNQEGKLETSPRSSRRTAVNGKSIPNQMFPRAIVMVARIINTKPVLDRPRELASSDKNRQKEN
jgi:hypothetical protein